MRYLGRDGWFNLDSAASSATTNARDIYLSLVAGGWDTTLAKYKPDPITKAEACTVGEFLYDVRTRGPFKLVTVRRYAVKLWEIVSDTARLEVGLRTKAKRQKYDHISGGRVAWIGSVKKNFVREQHIFLQRFDWRSEFKI